MQALSQLSYSPKLVLRGPVYTDDLVVLRRGQAQPEAVPAGDLLDWDEVRPPEIVAPGRDGVHLGGRIRSGHDARGRAAIRPRTHHDGITFAVRPLALNA